MAATRGDTRARILDTAWSLVQERGVDAVTVADIAAATGVSRQLVYVHFENRAGLLVAMARRHDVRSGFAGRAGEARSLAPVAALERLLRLWFAYVPEILPVARALEAAAINGDEGGLAWRDRMADLRELFAAALDRVAGHGRLAGGWTVPTAADWVWARAQPSTWQHLVGDRGWPPDAYADRAVRSILSEVVEGWRLQLEGDQQHGGVIQEPRQRASIERQP
jgi:AcrR family transcriptional regulator